MGAEDVTSPAVDSRLFNFLINLICCASPIKAEMLKDEGGGDQNKW